ncbi:MAG: aldo/keto reductase [Eubacterium sp.]|nr:aldo/keto reductase [Eubacterium sp.]
MNTMRLSNGIEIPAVGYGSFLSTVDKGKDVIKTALDAGYRYIDTASFYHNEAAIGEAIAEYGIDRKDIFLCSKVWPTMLAPEDLKVSFEKSLADLGTDYLDMFLIHWPKANQTDEDWKHTIALAWEEMEHLYVEGHVRAIGVSNFLPHHLKGLIENANIIPMVDQLELHVGYMQEYTLNYLKSNNILAQAWSPLGRAALLDHPDVKKIADTHGKSTAQILLKYLIQRDIAVIPKATSLERMRENQDLFDFELTWEELSYLSCLPETGASGEHPDRINWG